MMIKLTLYCLVLLIAFLGYRNASMAAVPSTGGQAPDFNLPNAAGEMMSLASFKGRWIVLYFYPRDDSPVCTKQACSFRDDLHKLEKLGAKVVGVSIDNGQSHADFAKKYSLPFPLLSDKDGGVARKYGALRDFMLIKMAKRYTFLISPDGLLMKNYLSVDTSRHSQQIIDDLSALQKV